MAGDDFDAAFGGSGSEDPRTQQTYRTAASHSESMVSSLPIISSTWPASMESGGATQIGRPRAIAGWRAAP